MTFELESVRSFVRVAQLASFTAAARQLGLSKSRVSIQVRGLEETLQVALLQRTTRVVRLTVDGEQFLPRAQRLLADADELATAFGPGRALKGELRVDLPVDFGANYVLPRLPEFVAAHPQLDLLVSTSDRRVDVLREGYDCVLRVGALTDPGLTARRLGVMKTVNCASPAYLARLGTPRTLEDLDRHLLVDYGSSLSAAPPTFEYPDGRGGYLERPMRRALMVNSASAFQAACRAGLGIIQGPRLGVAAALAAGTLVEVLPGLTCAPLPVAIVHAHGRSVPRRVRAFMGWLEQVAAPQLDGRPDPVTSRVA